MEDGAEQPLTMEDRSDLNRGRKKTCPKNPLGKTWAGNLARNQSSNSGNYQSILRRLAQFFRLLLLLFVSVCIFPVTSELIIMLLKQKYVSDPSKETVNPRSAAKMTLSRAPRHICVREK